jgi:hypothetical protein
LVLRLYQLFTIIFNPIPALWMLFKTKLQLLFLS